MSEILSIKGEGAISFSRCPENRIINPSNRKLADNTVQPYKFSYSRTALKFGLQSIDCIQDDVILIPDFICESVLEPMLALGVRIEYYPVTSALEPDWVEIEKLLNDSVKALMIVHYFGNPQQISQCIHFCNKHALLIIEDNAHGFGAIYNSQPLGTFGDIGFSSPRKSFSVSNGAYLYTKNKNVPGLSGLQLKPVSEISLKNHIKNIARQLPLISNLLIHYKKNDVLKKRLGPIPPYGSQDFFRDKPIETDYGMDILNDIFMFQQDLDQIRKQRQIIYKLWEKWTNSEKLRPVFQDISAGAMPLVFPAYTDSLEESKNWYERGHRAGVDIHSWPTLPMEIVKENGNAMRLYERMICFPIHQEMDFDLLQRRLSFL